MPKPRKRVGRKRRRRWSCMFFLVLILAGLITVYRLSWLGRHLPDFISSINEQRVDEDLTDDAYRIDRDRDRKSSGQTQRGTRSSQPPMARLEIEKLPPPKMIESLRRGIFTIRSPAVKPTITSDGKYVTHFDQSTGFVAWRGEHQSLIVTSGHSIVSKVVEIQAAGSYLPADLVAVDRHVDLALLRASARSFVPDVVLDISSKSALGIGDPCWVLTTKGIDGTGGRILSGEILGMPREVARAVTWTYGSKKLASNWFVLSQTTERGNSGAPVLDKSGRVTGVLVAGIQRSTAEANSLAVDSVALKQFLRSNAPREFR